MYKISVKKKNSNKTLVSVDTFKNVTEAEKAIDEHIQRQYKDCCSAWGLVAVEKAQCSANQYIATFRSIITFIKPLNLLYEIKEVKNA